MFRGRAWEKPRHASSLPNAVRWWGMAHGVNVNMHKPHPPSCPAQAHTHVAAPTYNMNMAPAVRLHAHVQTCACTCPPTMSHSSRHACPSLTSSVLES
eukprot:280829-Chlamydomonas_euryale.AAC.15